MLFTGPDRDTPTCLCPICRFYVPVMGDHPCRPGTGPYREGVRDLSRVTRRMESLGFIVAELPASVSAA